MSILGKIGENQVAKNLKISEKKATFKGTNLTADFPTEIVEPEDSRMASLECKENNATYPRENVFQKQGKIKTFKTNIKDPRKSKEKRFFLGFLAFYVMKTVISLQ